MTHCGDIENKLSAYLDGAVSYDEKKLIEEHLAHCPQCSAALSELKRTGDLLRGLEKMDPPPWFTQKVMARVREEAAPKKGLFEKLFYPFHIKIPLEVMATCLIAILAFSVYRNTGPEIKTLHEPQAPLAIVPQETVQGKPSVPLQAVPKTPPAHKADPDTLSGKQKDTITITTPDTKVGSGLQYNAVPPAATLERHMAEKKPVIKGERLEREIKADTPVKKSESQVMRETTPSPAPTVKQGVSVTPSREGILRESMSTNKARSTKDFQQALPEIPERFSISLRADNAETALRETEGLLKHFGARNISTISRHDTLIILGVDLPDQKIKDFREALKSVGNVKDISVASPSQEEYVRIRIEITTNK